MSYWSRSFRGLPEQVSDARKYVLTVLGDAPGVDDVVLAVSELASNAICHSFTGEPGGSFILHVADFEDHWAVRVDDEGGPKAPNPDHPEDSEEAGRGLSVVATLARDWGVLGDEYARAVWAKIPKPVKIVA